MVSASRAHWTALRIMLRAPTPEWDPYYGLAHPTCPSALLHCGPTATSRVPSTRGITRHIEALRHDALPPRVSTSFQLTSLRLIAVGCRMTLIDPDVAPGSSVCVPLCAPAGDVSFAFGRRQANARTNHIACATTHHIFVHNALLRTSVV